ncbi:hypothetical protein [Stenotrophobium rhamnosiphilum]|uniref:Uncharacterized protein n=1 Tax=Stenotrophobium rhamnosiphilum TaxID=2029166 RepID=A0A2T5MBV9_9GAMM|nr:hypothetical protein [Stenotrophobium rhamnosiphilum]PTU30055.1 hypothetical protein CJD38_16030 [Stenotrophobium rhamnosiphilum]
MTSAKMQGWVRVVAFVDLLATAPLAIPEISNAYAALLLSGFGLLGDASAYVPLPLTTSVFCVLTGILGILWNGCRLMRPDSFLVRADIWGRLGVASALIYFLVVHQAPVVLWVFVATELIGAVVEKRALSSLRAGGWA